MIEERAALNLRPGDEIEIDGNWWIVTDHKWAVNDPVPIRMQLRSRDREFISAVATYTSQLFRCEPHCC